MNPIKFFIILISLTMAGCSSINYTTSGGGVQFEALNDNADEIETFLTSAGFKSLSLSGYTLKEQINFFNHAKIIVGIHGAGITNILFARPGTYVIELSQSYDTDISQCYSNLSSALGLNHSTFITHDKVSNNYILQIYKLEEFMNTLI